MANVSISTIRSTLNTKLGEVSELKQVKIGRDTDLSVGFPACRFYLVGINSEQVDNAPSDYRTYRFAIDIIHQYTAQTVATGEATFQDACDAVLDKLNAEWHMGGIEHSVIEQSGVTFQETPQGPCAILPIIFQAKTLIY